MTINAFTPRPIRAALAGTLGGAMLMTGAAIVVPAGASAMSAPIQITSTVNIRPGASTASGNPIGSIPTGASPDYVCWAQGQNINGVDVWFKVNYAGRTGFYASYYDNSHYATDSQITSKYGIPNCSATPPPPPSSGASAAAQNWARGKLGQDYDRNLCLTFVFAAYSAAGVNLRNYVTVGINGNTYPVDIWGHFNHGTTGTGTPPAGALVFYASRNGDRTNSHVTLSVGGGSTVSTSDGVNANVVHYETVAQHSYANYLGWWLPV